MYVPLTTQPPPAGTYSPSGGADRWTGENVYALHVLMVEEMQGQLSAGKAKAKDLAAVLPACESYDASKMSAQFEE